MAVLAVPYISGENGKYENMAKKKKKMRPESGVKGELHLASKAGGVASEVVEKRHLEAS